MPPDNPNPNASIAFVAHYPFHYYVYKDVYKYLRDDAEFIIDLGCYFPNKQDDSVVNDVVRTLRNNGVMYRILNYEDYSGERVEHFLSRYDTLVSVWMRGCVRHQTSLRKKRVHLPYGLGKALGTFNLDKRFFDLILSYGGYDNAFFSLLTHSVIVGNPKFDDWFNGTDLRLEPDMAGRIDPRKKTLLYLPTHSDLSSIDLLAGELKRLATHYNVIAKLHYITPREDPEQVAELADGPLTVVQDDVDLLPLLAAADIVVSDNSSAIFDVILAGKPIVVTDFHDPAYLNTGHWQYKKYRRGYVGPSTYAGSIEQRIKRDGTVDTIRAPGELPDAIARILAHDEKKQRRDHLAEELFAFRDGSAGERAARAIRDLRDARTPVEKPFLYFALQQYTRAQRRRPSRSDPQ